MASLRSLRLRDFPDGRLRTIAVPVSRLALAHHVPAKLVREDPSNKAFPFPSMLASFPASMLNQSRPDLEIPHRIKLTSSRSSLMDLLPPRTLLWSVRYRRFLSLLSRSWKMASTSDRIVIFDQGFVTALCSM